MGALAGRLVHVTNLLDETVDKWFARDCLIGGNCTILMVNDNPTDFQVQIAEKLGIDVSKDSQAVAAARIREVVEPAINPGSTYRPATEKQIKFAASLGIEEVSNDSIWVCSAKIRDRLNEANYDALEKLKLKPGDKVIVTKTVKVGEQYHEYQKKYIVSSVGKNYRVYFKGGGGQGAWPVQIEKITN